MIMSSVYQSICNAGLLCSGSFLPVFISSARKIIVIVCVVSLWLNDTSYSKMSEQVNRKYPLETRRTTFSPLHRGLKPPKFPTQYDRLSQQQLGCLFTSHAGSFHLMGTKVTTARHLYQTIVSNRLALDLMLGYIWYGKDELWRLPPTTSSTACMPINSYKATVRNLLPSVSTL